MGWWSDFWIQEAQQWTYLPLQSNQVFDQLSHTPISSGKAYISIFLCSMRIVNIRELSTKFYGAVDSHISISQIEGQAEFHTLTTPSELKNIDSTNLDRVIVMDKRLLGPIPYNGGDVDIEIGLFSVKSSDLVEPLLNVLEDISKAAGVSVVSVAQPFIEPLLKGVNQLFNIPDVSRLEIGLSRTYSHPETGYFLVMRAAEGDIGDITKCALKQGYQLVDETGQSIEDYPYILIRVEASTTRDAWFEIPELADSYKPLKSALTSGTVDEINRTWEAFQGTVQTCSDLLEDDQNDLLSEVKQVVDKRVHTLQATPKQAMSPYPSYFIGSDQEEFPDLAQIPLYRNRTK